MKLLIAIVRGAGFCGVLAIIVLSVVPGTDRPHTGLPGEVEHFLAYCLTALILTLGFWSIASRIAIASALALLAVSMETVQLWVPGRHAAVTDALASSLGGLVGIVIGRNLLGLALQLYKKLRVSPARQPTA